VKRQILVLLFIFFTLSHIVVGLSIDFEKKILLSSKKVLLQLPISFCVTEDNLFMVVDFKAGDVKIYNSHGELETILGRKGVGPEEFVQPLFCHYSNRKFILPDAGQHRIFVYERISILEFNRTKSIVCLSTGNDIYLMGNRIYLAGNKIAADGKYYSFYSLDLNHNDKVVYFLPSYLKFGLASENEYKSALFKKNDLTALGVIGRFDIDNSVAYYIWQGDLKIFKIDLKTREITTFGKKMPHYIKPYPTKKLINAFFSRQGLEVQKERHKMSYVEQVFATSHHVMIIYTVPGQAEGDQKHMVQFYHKDGKFITEEAIPGKASNTMWFDKEKNSLYTIDIETDKNFEQTHTILKYKIHE
jgi:hypothetical protein